MYHFRLHEIHKVNNEIRCKHLITFFIHFQIINTNNQLDGFNIYFRPLDGWNLSSTDYKMVTLFNSGTTTYEVNGLLKFTQYEFFLVPFYKTIEGKPSNSRIVRTLEAGKHSISFNLIKTIHSY